MCDFVSSNADILSAIEEGVRHLVLDSFDARVFLMHIYSFVSSSTRAMMVVTYVHDENTHGNTDLRSV